MKIYNTKNTNFSEILKHISTKLNICVESNPISKNCYRVKLVKQKENKNYQRTGYYNNKDGTPRKVNAICWHGFRDFLNELYLAYPLLRVVTSQTTYTNRTNFISTFKATGYNNIGSQIQPLEYHNACLCNE